MGFRGLLVLLAFLAAFLPSTSAHSTYEASELEVHMINDEGSDLIEAYGGYDIQEVFAGFAHDENLGPGPDGDGIFFRVELYGDRAQSTVPQLDSEWTVTLILDVDGTLLTRTISTTDGASFTTDFDSLAFEVEERDTHIQRAFLSYKNAGIGAGQTLRIVQAESLVDGDVRDWAPGGIPIPGANGAAGGYEDPTAIPGQGLLVSSLVLEDASGYLRTESIQATADAATRRYNITLQNALQNGGQHVHVAVVDEAGWTYSLVGETMRVLDANQTMTFALVTEANGTGPLRLDVLTDVGGRLGIYVEPDGRMWTADGISAAPGEPGKTTGAPAPGVLLLVVALAAVAALRRR